MVKWIRIVGRGSRRLHLAVVCGLVLWMPQTGQAAPITFSFQGTATGISAQGMDPALIGVSLPFTGTFTLDDTDLNPDASTGQYNCAGCALPVWTLEIAGLSVAGNSATLNMTTAGQFSVWLTGAATTGIYPESFLNFNLGYGAGVFTDDSLPGAIPFPILSQSSRIQIYRTSGSHLYFHPVTLTPPGDTTTTVPEPGTLVLLGAGLLMLAQRVAAQRSRSTRQRPRLGDSPGRSCAGVS